ncbi:MAG: glycosyltransferase family 9 protein [Thermodesulfovibrionales bacterium]|nr:glycosyltransferase family 9 protein [Thermodesulfovibrionales bacterium]
MAGIIYLTTLSDIVKYSTMALDALKLKKPPHKILIIKPSSLGDVVHSLPFLNAIRDSFPRAEIHWIITKGLEGLLEGHPMINKLWIINKDDWKRIKGARTTIKELRSLFKSLKAEKYDIVIDLQGLLRSGILAKAAVAAVRVGFIEAREGSRIFYTHSIKGGKDVHAVDRYLEIAKFLGCDVSGIKFPFPLSFNFQLSTPNFQLPDKYAVIVPGARWETKRWHPGRFGELSSMLSVKSIVVGGESDTAMADIVVGNSMDNALSIAGKTTLKDLIEIIRHAKFVVTNDSGPMHIAAALNVPVFAIFGPTNPLRTGPYGKPHVIIRKGLECSPCYKKNCRTIQCMELISVQEVADVIRQSGY